MFKKYSHNSSDPAKDGIVLIISLLLTILAPRVTWGELIIVDDTANDDK